MQVVNSHSERANFRTQIASVWPCFASTTTCKQPKNARLSCYKVLHFLDFFYIKPILSCFFGEEEVQKQEKNPSMESFASRAEAKTLKIECRSL